MCICSALVVSVFLQFISAIGCIKSCETFVLVIHCLFLDILLTINNMHVINLIWILYV